MKSPECNSISVRLLNYSCALGLADDSYRFFSVAKAQEKMQRTVSDHFASNAAHLAAREGKPVALL